MTDLTTTADAEALALRVRGLSKSFGPNLVLKGAGLEVAQGEIVALMGPNGSGKSTIIKILDGVYRRDAGQVEVFGKDVHSLSGIPQAGVIHQDLGLVDELSVVENLNLGRSTPLLNHLRENRRAVTALDAVGMASIGVHQLVGSLNPAQKAMIAVARQLDTGARLIILDETTSTMSERESDWLLEHLREQADSRGTGVLIVSHRLREIQKVADRVVVLVDGRVIANDPVDEFRQDPDRVVKLFTGSVETLAGTHSEGTTLDRSDPGRVAVELRGVAVGTLTDIDLTLRAGEVQGLTGTLGSSLHELALVVAGRQRPLAGSRTVSPGESVALVPPQRETQSIFGGMTISENMVVNGLRRIKNRVGLLSFVRQSRLTAQLADDLQLKPRRTTEQISNLSGGNQQKVVFSRALVQEASIFVLCEPTRGVDVTTRQEIYRLIRAKAADGVAVALFSSDIEDILTVCDTVQTVAEDSVTPAQSVSGMRHEELAELM